MFYGRKLRFTAPLTRRRKTKFPTVKPPIYLPKCQILFFWKKMYYLHKATSAVSCVKPNASQWEATLRDDVGFSFVYRRIYRRNILTLSNQTSRYIRVH